MSTPEKWLKSQRWRDLRQRVILASDGICAWCGDGIDLSLSGRDPLGPNVDHKQSAVDHPEKFWDWDNLQVLHQKCNSAKSARGDRSPIRKRRNCPECGGELKINVSRHWGPCP